MKKPNLFTTAAFLATAMTVSSAQADTYDIDESHTYVIFKVNHLGIGNSYGMFRKTTGSFDTEKGMVNISIDAKSLFTANKKRDEHLNSPDFFNTKQFPTITFKSSKVKAQGKKMVVTGELTMKGKTKTVSFTAMKTGEGKDPWGNFRQGYEGTLTLNRMDFGVDFMPDGLSKEIELIISVEGIKKK